jgi:hypothetical protein
MFSGAIANWKAGTITLKLFNQDNYFFWQNFDVTIKNKK